MHKTASKQALVTMLTMQDSMNRKVHSDWIAQNFEWYRAIWIECGELMDHYGYKWWKKQEADIEQVRLEVIDIWHFGMSALFGADKDIEALAENIVTDIEAFSPSGKDVREATEALAAYALEHKTLSVPLFWELMHACQLDFEALYRHYVGKNVLNFFRQDHGYKEGSYIKQWQGREDNEHLSELLADLDSSVDSFADDIYRELGARYQLATA